MEIGKSTKIMVSGRISEGPRRLIWRKVAYDVDLEITTPTYEKTWTSVDNSIIRL